MVWYPAYVETVPEPMGTSGTGTAWVAGLVGTEAVGELMPTIAAAEAGMATPIGDCGTLATGVAGAGSRSRGSAATAKAAVFRALESATSQPSSQFPSPSCR